MKALHARKRPDAESGFRAVDSWSATNAPARDAISIPSKKVFFQFFQRNFEIFGLPRALFIRWRPRRSFRRCRAGRSPPLPVFRLDCVHILFYCISMPFDTPEEALLFDIEQALRSFKFAQRTGESMAV